MKKSIFLFFAAILCASSVWGANNVKGGYIYFDNSITNWTKNIQFVIGHNNYSRTYEMAQIENTLLWYENLKSNTYYTWGDATYYGFIAHATKFGDGDWGSSNLKNATNYTAAYTGSYGLNDGSTYYCKPSNATNGKSFTIEYKDSYGAISKYDATQAAKVRNTKKDSYTNASGNWPATLKLKGTYLSGNGTSGRSEISSTKSSDGNDKRVYGAVVTGKITHSYTSLSSDYHFEGWGSGDQPSTSNSTYDYNITAKTTVYAFFTKKYQVKFEVVGGNGTITAKADGSKINASGDKAIGGSDIVFTATPAVGYGVEGWYSDAGCTQKIVEAGSNTEYTISTLSAATSVYVRFVAAKYYLTGNAELVGAGNAWNATAIEMPEISSTYSYTFGGLQTNIEYKLKITNNLSDATWGFNALKTTPEGVYGDDDDNVCFKLRQAGDVTVSFDGSKITLSTANGAEFLPYVQIVTSDNWENKINFTVNGNIATANLPLTIGEHEFKIIENGTWKGNSGVMSRVECTGWTFDSSNNAKIYADVEGTYQLTWNLDKDQLSVKYPAVSGTLPFAITGTMNNWDNNANKTTTTGKTASITIHMDAAKQYEFKVALNNTLLGNGGTMSQVSCTNWDFKPTESKAAQILTHAAGDYIFTWDYETYKLSVTYPAGTATPDVYLDWYDLDPKMTKSADGKTAYTTLTMNDADKRHEFAISYSNVLLGNNGEMTRTNCEGWTFDPNERKATLYVDVTGDYTFTWEYATNKLTVTYPAMPLVALRGTMCNGTGDDRWNETNQIVLNEMEDAAHAYAKVYMNAGTYSFKIVQNNTDWFGYKDDGQTMTKSNHANWQFTSDNGNNVNIKIETAGNYYFTWNYAAKKLTVTYPITVDETAKNTNLNGYFGKVADVILNRAFTNTYWQTITLPFTMTAAHVTSVFGNGTQIAKLASSDVSSKNNEDFVLNFDYVNKIEAGVPYLIKPTNAVAAGTKIEEVVMNTNTHNITTNDALMIPVLDKTTFPTGNNNYWLAENGYLYGDATEMKALRAYFQFPNIPSNKAVRARVAFNENVETDVEEIVTTEVKAVKVIENGQLIIIREGVKYNMQGQKL